MVSACARTARTTGPSRASPDREELQMSRITKSVIAVVATLAFGSAWAADAGSPGQEIKEGAQDVGSGVKEAATGVGHATRDTAKSVGHKTKRVAKKAGHAVAD